MIIVAYLGLITFYIFSIYLYWWTPSSGIMAFICRYSFMDKEEDINGIVFCIEDGWEMPKSPALVF
ncbi:hypothetical protein HK27_10560 [Acetobacter orientalis]|nr:hypothetical protein HK27_10560 [Acetobacter orientalis]